MINLAIIQARMGASRLPDKVLLKLNGRSVLEQVIERVQQSNLIDDVVVATTIDKRDLAIVKLCAELGVNVFCGSEDDVLDRYYQTAKLFRPLNVIRITADCPLLDTEVLSLVIQRHKEYNGDYTSNTLEPTYPDGLDCEIMKFSVLEETWREAKMASEREHVTQYIIHNEKYKKISVKNDVDYSSGRWTLDTLDDYKFIQTIYEELGEKCKDFHTICEFVNHNPHIREINSGYMRNEGLKKSLDNDYIMEKTRG